MFDEDQLAMLSEYGIDAALDTLVARWRETGDHQRSKEPAGIEPSIVKELRVRFEADVQRARAHLDRTKPRTVVALHRARERLQLVSEHVPLDSEIQVEHAALSPVLAAIERALVKFTALEAELAQRGRLPWYRRRICDHSYLRRKAGPVALGHAPGATWVAGDDETELATRTEEIVFDRAGADPVVGLRIALAVVAAVKPPVVRKNRGQYEDEQIDHVIALMKHKEVQLTTKQISELLVALGYPPAKVTVGILDQRAKKLRGRGVRIAIAKTARGKTLGRRREPRI